MKSQGYEGGKLTGLVNVVVLVLADVGTDVLVAALDITSGLHVLVHGALLVQLGLVLWEHVLLVLADDGGGDAVHVLSVKDLFVLDGLDAVLVVVDVALAVNSLGGLGVLLRADVLLHNLGCGLGANLHDVSMGSVRRVGRRLASVESGLKVLLRKSLTPEVGPDEVVVLLADIVLVCGVTGW